MLQNCTRIMLLHSVLLLSLCAILTTPAPTRDRKDKIKNFVQIFGASHFIKKVSATN